MKNMSQLLRLLLVMSLLSSLFGCTKKEEPPAEPATPAKSASELPSAKPLEEAKPAEPARPKEVPALEAALAALDQGDKDRAINSFVAADWSSGPLFSSSSLLSLSEDQYAQLLRNMSKAEREAKGKELPGMVRSIRELAFAVKDAALEKVAKGEIDGARKYFTALKECGTAIENGDYTHLLKMVGRAVKNIGEGELEKLSQ